MAKLYSQVAQSQSRSEQSAIRRAATENENLSASSCACGGHSHDIRRMATSLRQPDIQRAMEVSQPGDPSEVEAERMADAVMRQTDIVAREAPEEEELQMKRETAPEIARESPEEEELQTQRASTGELARESDVSQAVQSGLSGGGQPMDGGTRSLMESRFGHDFGDIRIHTGEDASASADAVSARAYAVGGDIAFRDGEYNPGTGAGQHLLAHELTHTIQQGAAVPLKRSRR